MADKKYLDQEGLAKLWELINNNFEDTTSHELDIEELRALIDAVDQKTDTTLSGKVSELEQKIDANKAETDAAIEQKIAEVVDNAPEAFDTLKEIADYVQGDDGRTLDLIERVNDLEKIHALTEAEIEEICERVNITTKVTDVADFKEAMAKSGIVKLTQDLVLTASDSMQVPTGTSVDVNLNGHNINLNAPGAYSFIANGGNITFSGEGSIQGSGRVAGAYNGGTVTVEGGLLKSDNDVALSANGAGSKVIINNGTIESQEGGVLITTGAATEINGGTISATDNFAVAGNGSPGQGNVEIVINDGELISNIQSAGYVACGIYMPNSGTLTINGGHIVANGGAGIVCRGGETFINGGTITTTAHPTLTEGKVGDSRQVVPCAAVVYDKNSKYPAMDTLAITIGENAILESAVTPDIAIISDEAEPNIVDNRA